MTDSMAGKTIWVIGGAGFLGTAITKALDKAAAKVVCIDIANKAETLVREKSLSKTVPFSWDVSEARAIEPTIGRLINEHGVPDGVAHLAYLSSAGKRLEDLSSEDLVRTFSLTLPPTFLLCRSLAEKMKSRGHGSIVLFSSMYGLVSPDPRIYEAPLTPNPIDYGATKAAFLQMTRYFAVHYGPHGIRFNSVTPGSFPNPGLQKDEPAFIQKLCAKTPLGRVGRNEEIVGPTLFLLGDGSSYVTGHSLVVDGGWTSW